MKTAHCMTLKGEGKGISWKVRSNFVIQPRPTLLCVLQYQSDMVWAHQRASALICWRLGVCAAQRLTFHLAQNLGFARASVIRWLTIITPRENEREEGGQRRASEWRGLWAAVYSVLQSHFLFSAYSLSSSPHLKFSLCVSSTRDSLCDMIYKHRPSLTNTRGPRWLVHVLHRSGGQTLLLHCNVLLYWVYMQYIIYIFLFV